MLDVLLWCAAMVRVHAVQIDHPEIKGRAHAVEGGGFDAFGADGTDGHGHGTHCGEGQC